MSTFTISKTQLLPRPFVICVVAGVAYFMMTSSTLAFQSVGTPQSPKNAAIENLERQINTVRDSFVEARSREEENRATIQELLGKRKEIYDNQDSLGISKESFGDVLKNLQAQRIELMIDLAGIEARRDSLTEIQETEISRKSDPSAIELLSQLVQLHLKRLDDAKRGQAQGLKGPNEVNDAQVDYLNAKLKLSNVKNAIQVSPRINEELLNVSLDRAEKQARLVKTEELLKTIIASRSILMENENVTESIDAAKRKKELLESQVETLQKKLKSLEVALFQLRNDDSE